MRSVAWPSAAVSSGRMSSSRSQPPDRVAQLDDEVGLDRVLDDRVAVGVDPREVLRRGGIGENDHRKEVSRASRPR